MSRIFHNQNYVFGRLMVLELETPLTEHSHSDCHLIFSLNADGVDKIRSLDSNYELHRNRAVAIGEWAPHEHWQTTPGGSLIVVFYLSKAWLADAGYITAQSFTSSDFEVSDDFADYVEAFAKNLEADKIDASSEDFALGVLERCFHLIAPKEEEPDNLASAASTNTMQDTRVLKSMLYMQTNLSTRMDIEKVARQSGLSRPHLFKLFKSQVRSTPSVYWNTLRMEAAIDQLVESDAPLHKLAADLGFSEPGNFSRFFRSRAGVSPSQFRRSMGGDQRLEQAN